MIQRKNNVSPNAAEVSFTVSYTAYDVWSWFEFFGRLLHRNNPFNYDYAFGLVISEADIVHFLVNEPKCIGWMPEKHATPIAQWAINIAFKQGYITKEEKGYKLSPRLKKKNGRPKENDV